MEKRRFGQVDQPWLGRCFHKLLLVFTSWVNKVDREGNNVFEGGFLGLDTISVFDRSDRLPDGSTLEQADATGWMGMFCLCRPPSRYSTKIGCAPGMHTHLYNAARQ